VSFHGFNLESQLGIERWVQAVDVGCAEVLVRGRDGMLIAYGTLLLLAERHGSVERGGLAERSGVSTATFRE
jgi:hypothetical protein